MAHFPRLHLLHRHSSPHVHRVKDNNHPTASATPKPRKTIILIRHAEAYHNLKQDDNIHDPELSPAGIQQAEFLSAIFPYFDRLEAPPHIPSDSTAAHAHHDIPLPAPTSLIVASPLKRTLQTALIGLRPAIDKGVIPILAEPMFQETTEHPCDRGSERSELETLFSKETADGTLIWNDVRDGWNEKTGINTSRNVPGRAVIARRWLKARPESTIIVVTHGGFLHYLTDDWSREDANLGTSWHNTEFRSYNFHSEEEMDFRLVETDESKAWRHADQDGQSAQDVTSVEQMPLMQGKAVAEVEKQRTAIAA